MHIDMYIYIYIYIYPPTPALAMAGAAPGTTAGVELAFLLAFACLRCSSMPFASRRLVFL